MKTKLSKLTENQKLVCDAPITLEECKNALNQLHTNNLLVWMGLQLNFIKLFGMISKSASLIQLLFSSIFAS